VTGFGTLFGSHLANGQTGNAVAALAVPLFFLIGAVISGLCVEARVRQNKMPHYDYVMYACSFLLGLACLIGTLREQDQIQTAVHLERNFVVLSLICLSSGLINAALSYSSHSTVRITHLTGLTTDLGRGIAEIISLRLRKMQSTRRELRTNFLRVLTIAAFVSGAVVGAVLFKYVAFYSLLIPAVYFAYAGVHGRKIKYSFSLQLSSLPGDRTVPTEK
jgi:uncharacterized membrane protein YoaK (UPF0700 family)